MGITNRRKRNLGWAVALPMALALTGCSQTLERDDDDGFDVGDMDVSADSTLDVPVDAIPDVPTDSTLDVPVDATPDVPTDTAMDVPGDIAPDTIPDVTPDADVGPDVPDECGLDETVCARSRDCFDAGLSGFICTDGCCEPPVEICRDHLDPCTSADASTDVFICDTDEGVCLSRCEGDTANDTGSIDCPRGSWCLGTNVEPPGSDPSLNGVCLPGDCTSIFDGECGAEFTCLPIGNETSFCIPAGAGGEGDACNQAGGLAGAACDADIDCPSSLSCSDGTCVQCGSDDECGGSETCSAGDCVPEADVCDAGLLCFQGACIAPCNLDNGDGDCAGEDCVAVFDTTNDNSPGACGTGCTMFSSGECPLGEACNPTSGRTGLNEAVCAPLGDTTVGPGEDCSAAEATCGEGYTCLNEGTVAAPDLNCSQWCDPSGGIETFSNCGATEACFPSSIDGLGFCTEGCEPYPRMGSGNYGCATGNDCRPFVPGLSANWEDAQGICIDFAADTAAFAACETNFTFECEDFGLCLDLSFEPVEAPVCMPLCEPFSEGQCPNSSVCSPIFPLLGTSEFATCDPYFVEAAIGDSCVNTFPAGNPVPCSDDGTLCLGDGTGSSSCVAMCRAGFSDCPVGSSCQAPAFNDPIPPYMGICQ